jgi:hypothetical protein
VDDLLAEVSDGASLGFWVLRVSLCFVFRCLLFGLGLLGFCLLSLRALSHLGGYPLADFAALSMLVEALALVHDRVARKVGSGFGLSWALVVDVLLAPRAAIRIGAGLALPEVICVDPPLNLVCAARELEGVPYGHDAALVDCAAHAGMQCARCV